MNSIARHLRLPPRRIVLWHSLSAVPLGTLIAIGASLSYHYHDLAEQNQLRVNRSYQVLDGIDGLFSSVEAAALAERDFVITGDAEALGQFQRSILAFRNRSQQLTPLVRSEPIQAAVLSDIDQTIAAQFVEFSQAIETRNSQGYEGARAIIALQATGATMEALRQKIDRFAASERSSVNDGLRIQKLHERRIIVSGIAIAMASLLIRLCITLWVRRAGRQRPGRSQADEAMKASSC
jgi:CHASE3 domain sensor protein